MILVSVGTQLPFDRMVRAVDAWAQSRGRTDVIAQVGPSRYQPVALTSFPNLAFDRFRALQQECRLMVCHAGMGSIITALEFGKPIIIMPRDHRLGEHRNGHQLATVRQFGDRPGIYPAETPEELSALLDRSDTLTAVPSLDATAPGSIVDQLSRHVRQPAAPSLIRRMRHLLRGARS